MEEAPHHSSHNHRIPFIPVQLIPSPEYPTEHSHLWDPNVLVQVAFALQWLLSPLHSSKSFNENNNDNDQDNRDKNSADDDKMLIPITMK